MKKNQPGSSLQLAAQAVALAGLLVAGTAHAGFVHTETGGPGGSLTNASGMASVTSQHGSSSQTLAAGQTSASANVNASGMVAGQSGSLPYSIQLQSSVSQAGNLSLFASTSIPSGSQALAGPGSFLEQASWQATLVNTTGKTASFGVDLSGNSSFGPYNDGLQLAATASFGNQQYDVSGIRQGYAIDGVVLKPGESATVSLDYKIIATNPDWNVANPSLSSLSYQASFVNSFSEPVAAVPEPDTTAMMVAGLAGVAFVARRRKRGASGKPAV